MVNKQKASSATSRASLDPDRPIESIEADRLGFADIAENLAKAVASNSAQRGFVIGIEGAWGSGKSSILNLLGIHLQKVDDITVLRFDPWIVGDRDSLVSSLIGDLATAIEETRNKKDGVVGKAKAGAKDLASQLRSYGATTSRGLSRLAQLGAFAGVPGSDAVAKVLTTTGEILDGKTLAIPLPKQRAAIFRKLVKFNHRFVVMVDDLDRLEPAEAAEIMRLIRAVGDFPNVVYLLCYDHSVLSKSLQVALGVEDGSAFLRKVVQASFRIPKPEEFDLRRLLLAECHALFEAIRGEKLEDEEMRQRLAEVCDKEGSLVQTPRDIALVLNALRLVYPAVADKVDFADMCWLQVVRTLDDGLYRWAERYLAVFAAVAGGFGMVSQREREELANDLLKLLKDPKGHSIGSTWRVSDIIPGVGRMFDANDKERQNQVLKNVGAPTLGLLEQRRRLGSPQHYRYYFSFSRPAGALDDAVFAGVISDVRNEIDIVPTLLALVNTQRPQGGTMYGVLLDRLHRTPLVTLDGAASRRLLFAIANTVDDAERKQPRGGTFGERDNWESARSLLHDVLEGLPEIDRGQFIGSLFTTVSSLGWLMGSVIGKELFDHGRVGGPARAAPEDRLLTPQELDRAIDLMDARLQGVDSSRIIDAPALMAFLYRWKQAGREASMRRWTSAQMVEDDHFLLLLDRCRGWRMSNQVSYPLMKKDISIFVEFEAMKQRLVRLANDEAAPPERRIKAAELVDAAEMGEKDLRD